MRKRLRRSRTEDLYKKKKGLNIQSNSQDLLESSTKMLS